MRSDPGCLSHPTRAQELAKIATTESPPPCFSHTSLIRGTRARARAHTHTHARRGPVLDEARDRTITMRVIIRVIIISHAHARRGPVLDEA